MAEKPEEEQHNIEQVCNFLKPSKNKKKRKETDDEDISKRVIRLADEALKGKQKGKTVASSKTVVAFNSREDHRKKHAPAEVDEDGKEINPHGSYSSVFGSSSKQKDLFDQVVGPIVKEALEGYSWTISVYGKTGTGKTNTIMESFMRILELFQELLSNFSDTLEAQNAEYIIQHESDIYTRAL